MPNLSDLIPPRLGTSGYSGYSSSSGTSGYSGHSGYSAYSGYSGYSGKSGYSAYSGTSWSGYSAYSGSSGTSAYSGVAGAATGNLDVTVTAGEALSARDFVYVAPVTGGGLTAGRAYKADADTVRASTQGFYFGFVVANISAAATGTVRIMGSMAGFTVTAGAPQYLSTTAGAITETAPTNSLMVGIALDSSTVLINSFGSTTGLDSNYGTAGYVNGGWTDNVITGTLSKIASKLTFSTETMATKTTADLSVARMGLAATGNTLKGYFSGGTTTGGANYTALTDKLTYSTETTASQTTANLSTVRVYPGGGVSEGSSKGFFCGGYSAVGSYVATADKITYSGDSTAATTTANLTSSRLASAGVSFPGNKAYCCGGSTGANAQVTTDKLTFSSDTTAAATTANLSSWSGREKMAGISEGSSKGYVLGGEFIGTADKITFSSDTTAACTTADLTHRRYGPAGISQVNAGYISGGVDQPFGEPGFTSDTDKLVFSSDTTSACTTASLGIGTAYTAGVSDVGW